MFLPENDLATVAEFSSAPQLDPVAPHSDDEENDKLRNEHTIE